MKHWKFVAAALLPLAAQAADDTGKWYLTPEIGRINTDDRRGVAPTDWIYGLRFGRHLTDIFSTELSFTDAQISGRSSGDLELLGGAVDLLATANRGGGLAPYLLAGVGVVNNGQTGGPDHTDLMAEAGVGVLARLWKSADGAQSLSLRPEYKLRWNDSMGGNKLRDEVISVGLQFAFGAPEAVAVPVARSIPVEPAPAAAPPPPPPPPADSDGDGVIDPQDQCPGTPAGVAVDALGCTRVGSITLQGVGFETDSNQLTSDSREVLDKAVADLRKYAGLRVEVQGYTDSVGADAYNLKLSQRRAEAVRDYMVQAGVPADQLVARGYGEANPVAPNTSAEGRATNRRVVMLVLSNTGAVKVTTPETPETTVVK